MAFWAQLPDYRWWLASELNRLLDFGRALEHPDGGAAYLGVDGTPEPETAPQTWITARMTHVYCLGHLAGIPGCRALAATAMAGLTGPLRDTAHGGWHHSADPATQSTKAIYDQAFVMLAAVSANHAGLPGSAELLAESTATFLNRFWDDEAGMCIDEWDATWQTPNPYRGINGNMHAVEAMLAVGAWTHDASWHKRADRVIRRVIHTAKANEWRIPEHYTTDWVPVLEFNADNPADQFKPYGATVGHGLEWARLMLHLEAAIADGADEELLGAAEQLFARAVTDGWHVDGQPGFIYTTDWTGEPVVRDRFHWVLAEAIAASTVLAQRTGRSSYIEKYALWWDYARNHLIDTRHGSWYHELDPDNQPAGRVWPGKPDLYHAVQAVLLPTLPLQAGLASALDSDRPGTRNPG